MTRLKGFFPYIMIVFFNAFVDLGHKMLIQSTLYDIHSGARLTILVSIVNALILLPYLFLFTPSGFVSDKYSKVSVMRITAIAAIPLTMLVTWSYFHGNFRLAFIATLLLAIQSAMNSPAKYGYIKDFFGKANIAPANALVQTVGILAILAGSLVFTAIFEHFTNGLSSQAHLSAPHLLRAFAPAGFLLIFVAILESVCTFLIPQKSATDPQSTFVASDYIRCRYLMRYLKQSRQSSIVFLCILGLALFWSVNQALLACYSTYIKAIAGHPGPLFVQEAFAMAGVGILFGAIYAGRVSKGFIEAGLIPVGALGMTVSLFLLPHLVDHRLILIFFVFYGFFGGVLLVPLNALVQFNAKNKNLGKVLAASNFIQNIGMLSFLLLGIVYANWVGGNLYYFFMFLAALSLSASIYALIKLPQSLIRFSLYFFVSKLYKLGVDGLESFPSNGGVLLLGNHTSFLDWAILQIASPRPIRFVMLKSYYNKWYFHWVLSRLNMIPISAGSSKAALESIYEALANGDVVAMFPEGRLSLNGQINEFKSGFERAVQNTGAQIIPFYLLGLWGSSSSYATDQYRQLTRISRRDVSVTFGRPLPDYTDAPTLKQVIYELSTTAWKNHMTHRGTIAQEWLRRVKYIPNQVSVIDDQARSVSNVSLMAMVLYFRKKIRCLIQESDRVGILLPPSLAGVIANMAVVCSQKVLVNINFTMNVEHLKTSLISAEVKTIITSRLFLKRLSKKGYDLDELSLKFNFIYMEDLKEALTPVAIGINYAWLRLLPMFLLEKIILGKQNNEDTAALLFSSGSESAPKGVELSHRNIVGNVKQISSIFNIQSTDVVLSSLPLFHAFGLTVTTFLPLLEGVPMVTCPDATDGVTIGRLAYKYRVSVMCGTSTLFGMYCRQKKILPQMLSTLRLIIAGAEKLSEANRLKFKEKFNKDIYEGYGATEVAPVASCNLPNVLSSSDFHLQIANKPGTVGLPLPGTAFKVVDPDSFEPLPRGEAGLVLIGGTQVMRSYLNNPEKTASVLKKEGAMTWYITGDKGCLDADGFLTIVDRYSRFAKIAGEMISLSQVESAVGQCLPDMDVEIMAVALPDDRKGEKIILMVSEDIDIDLLKNKLKESLNSPLLVPSKIVFVKDFPRLGSGKKDYKSAKKMCMDLLSNPL